MNEPLTTPLRVEQVERHTISIEPSLWDYATLIGNGNASAGIRLALSEARKRENTGVGKPASAA